MSEFYQGSKLLNPMTKVIGMPIDQLNFLFCQTVAFFLGIPFRHHLSVRRASAEYRMMFELLCGIGLALYCFGYQIIYLIIQALATLFFLRTLPYEKSCYVNFIFCILYLSIFHLLRQYYDYGGYTMDITGPLMIQTQKLSSLGFNYKDGCSMKKEDTDNENLKKHAIFVFPNLLEFFSYIFYFHGIIVGPFVFYADYKRFINGLRDKDGNLVDEETLFPRRLIQKHLAFILVFGILTLIFTPRLPFGYFISDVFTQSSLLYKVCYVFFAAFIYRLKYYFAWELACVINLNSGLGYSGESSEKEPQYDIVTNFDFWEVELGLNSKVVIDGWNKTTLIWLRECVYERVPRKHGTLAVFVCSAFWHGFYPGYYCFFLTLAGVTIVGRMCRKRIRPLMHRRDWSKYLYHASSWFGVFLIFNYTAISFVLLDIVPTLIFWKSMYFIPHIGCFLLYCLCLWKPFARLTS